MPTYTPADTPTGWHTGAWFLLFRDAVTLRTVHGTSAADVAAWLDTTLENIEQGRTFPP